LLAFGLAGLAGLSFRKRSAIRPMQETQGSAALH
jgi:hypothetical protein